VKIVRFHTRVPVVDPEKVDAALIAALKASGKTVYVALHANHPRELTADARAACARLVDAGIVMVSQSVLLKGVNDDPDTWRADAAFVEMPHQALLPASPDLAPGTSHFRLCQPTYVLDIPDGHGKVPIGPDYLAVEGEVEDPNGVAHVYPPKGD
jgi:lysine 2,3-aminomutase